MRRPFWAKPYFITCVCGNFTELEIIYLHCDRVPEEATDAFFYCEECGLNLHFPLLEGRWSGESIVKLWDAYVEKKNIKCFLGEDILQKK